MKITIIIISLLMIVIKRHKTNNQDVNINSNSYNMIIATKQ